MYSSHDSILSGIYNRNFSRRTFAGSKFKKSTEVCYHQLPVFYPGFFYPLYCHGWFEIIGGSLVVILGLHFAGLFKLKFLEREKKIHLDKKPLGIIGTVLVGMAFGAGWTPCVGPILGSILTMAAATQNVAKGIILLISYSIGLGIPFLLTGLLIHKFFEYFKTIRKCFRVITLVGGILLVIIGLLLISGYFTTISSFLGA